MIDATSIGLAIAFILTLLCYTFPLYKDNVLYQFCENTLIGLSIGHTSVIAINRIRDLNVKPIMAGNYTLLILTILGIMLFARFSKQYHWAYTWPMAIMIGGGTGIAMRSYIHAQFLNQIKATMISFSGKSVLDSINSILILIFVICTISFFLFTYEQKGPLRTTSMIGRIVLMATFGAVFANVSLTRLAAIAGRILFILQTLGLVS